MARRHHRHHKHRSYKHHGYSQHYTNYAQNPSLPPTPTSKNKSKLSLILLAVVILILAIIVILYLPTTSLGKTIFSSNSTAYLTQNQLFSIYGVGSYGSLNTGSKETVNGTALDSFISQGSQLANFSIPSIVFTINTSISNITIDKSFLVGFRIRQSAQDQLLLREQVISSPQASYLFFAQSQIATYDGYINGMQYYLVNGTEVIANKDNYVIIFKCGGVLCSPKNINETILAVSNDNI